jgi:hypothetical protein
VGISAGIGLQRIIAADGTLTGKDQIAITIVDRRGGVFIPNSLIGDGAITKSDAADVLERLRTLANSGQLGRTRDAAKWLLYETPFEECPTNGMERGPFALECVRQEFQKAGCQASGSAFPTVASIGAYDDATVSDMRTQFRDMYDRMNREALPSEQDEAVKACLGITMQREKGDAEKWEITPNDCRDPGIEYFYYIRVSGEGGINVEPRRVLMFHTVSPSFLTVPQDRVGVARFYVSGSDANGETLQMTSMGSAGAAAGTLKLNGAVQSVGRATMIPRRRNKIELEGGAVGVEGLPPERFLLGQSAWKPMISLDARKDGWRDTNDVLQTGSLPTTRTTTSMTRWSITMAPGTPVSMTANIGAPVIRSITCMMKWTALDSQTTLFQFDDGTTGSTSKSISLQIIEKIPTFIVMSPSATFQCRFKGAALKQANTWVHMAVSMERAGDAKFYMNGKLITDPAPNKTGQLSLRNMLFSRLMLGGSGFTGAISWFHVYDRAISDIEVKRDMEFDNPSFSDKDFVIPNTSSSAAELFKLEQAKQMPDSAVAARQRTQEVSVDACARLADATHLTTAFTYDSATKECKLFQYTVPDRVAAPATLTLGTKPYFIKKGFTLAGRPLNTFSNVELADECGDLCANEKARCGGWMHNANTKRCHLMRNVSNSFVPVSDQNIQCARMATTSDARNQVLQRGACLEGTVEYGLTAATTVPGKCCPLEGTLSEPDLVDYQKCTVSMLSGTPCTMNMNDTTGMRKC